MDEKLSAQNKIVQELASKSDFAGAAAAQEEVKKIVALGEQLREKNKIMQEFLARKDVAWAASAQKEIKALERRLMVGRP